MSPSNLKSIAATLSNVTAGLEFEMYVPDVESSEREPEYEYDYSYDGYITTGNWKEFKNDIVNFFTSGDFSSHTRAEVGRLIDRDVEPEYQDWLARVWDEYAAEEFSSWWERNNSKDEPEPKLGTSEYNHALDEFRDSEFNNWVEDGDKIDDWLEDEHNDKYSLFGDRFDLLWPHMRDVNEDKHNLLEIKDIAEEFSKIVNMRVVVSDQYHGKTKPNDAYVIEPDSSLERKNRDDDCGLEFVSPPLPLPEMLNQLEKVKNWAKKYGCYTNETTGLHMNISMPGYSIANLDYVKLALFLGDEWVSKQFGRLGNTYAQSSLEKIKEKIGYTDIPSVLTHMKNGLSKLASKIIHSGQTDKYVTINTYDNRIEFRSPGGNWIEEDLSKLTNTLLRFAVALDIALDPQKEQQEYAKKFYKLISTNTKTEDLDTLKYFSQYAVGKLSFQNLKRYVKTIQVKRKQNKMKTNSNDLILYNIIRNYSGEIVHQFLARDFHQAENIMASWIISQGFNAAKFRLDYAETEI